MSISISSSTSGLLSRVTSTHHGPASRQGHILAPINSLYVCMSVCIVAKSQVSDFNGSRLCIVGVISPSSQAEQL